MTTNGEFWEIADFDHDIINNELVPEINSDWKCAESYINKNSEKLQIQNKAFRTINELDYLNTGLDLKLNFTLHKESQLWIFTKCFVNKDINESSNFDNESINNGPGEIFNKYTSVILINKQADSNKLFISFGTFYEDNEEKIFKIFAKRQLVDYDKINNDSRYQ